MTPMSTFNFPPLRIGLLHALTQLKERYDADPECLTEAPYDPETVSILQALFAPKIVEKKVEVEVVREARVGRGRPTKDVALSAEDQEKLKSEISTLMKELNGLGTGGDENGEVKLPTGERIQIVKVKASLIDQLLKMQERIFNVKRMSTFQEVVIGILDDLIKEDDREVFLRRIEPYRDG